jgi:predicted metal-dependent hydrolase
MPTLQIGGAEIPYELRRSATASERRITVTPGHVEVLALPNDDEEAVAGFLDRKRQWLLKTVREMERITANRHAVPRFMTGSKIPYRGRKMPLTVRRTDAERIAIAYRNGFIVDLPNWAWNEPDRVVATELKLWMRQRVRRDVKEIATAYGTRFGLVPRSIRVADFPNGWGSCGPEGNILINWHLNFAPKQVLDYVVIHELAHLRHRSHREEFWTFLGSMLPDFERPKAWLEANQGTLTSDFLVIA